MKRVICGKIILLVTYLVLLFNSSPTYSEPKLQLTRSQIQDLHLTCKVWGFLKYHSPVVAKGNLDWDSVLIVSIDKIIVADSTKTDVKNVLNYLVLQAEAHSVKKSFHPDKIDPNSRWIRNTSELGEETSQKLISLYFLPKPKANFYTSCKPDDPYGWYFCNEKPYTQFELPPVSYRLLGLFRYWNIINYFYPYRDIIIDYDKSLYEMIPVMYNVSSVKEYAFALWKMSSYIEDSHGELAYKVFNKLLYKRYYAPFEVRLIENKVIISDIFYNNTNIINPVKIGDQIVEMPGMPPIEVFMDSFLRYIKLSNDSYTGYYISNFYHFSSADSLVTLKVLRDDKIIPVNANYFRLRQWQSMYSEYFNGPADASRIINGNVGYINLSKFRTEQADSLMRTMKNTKGIVFDMRGYPNIPWDPDKLVNYLIKKKNYQQAYWEPDFRNPGKFIRSMEKVGQPVKKKDYYKGKVVILVNERTKSAAEGTVMMFQSTGRAITVGSQTAGTNGISGAIHMPGGARISITQFGIGYPNGTPTQRIGVKIDHIVKPTIKGISAGKDEVLEKAIEIISN